MPQYTPEQRRVMIDQIARLPSELEVCIHGLSARELMARPLAGQWSVAQNVHHLADSHMNSLIRCKLMLTEDRPPLKPYNQDKWAALADTDNPDITMSLQLLTGLHARWAILFLSLNEDQWLRVGLHPDIGAVTMEDQLRIYSAHGEGHIDQIKRTLAAGTTSVSQ